MARSRSPPSSPLAAAPTTDGCLTATRFAQKPLHQPAYSFRDVPAARKDLTGSSLQRIVGRAPFVRSMAELLLVCKEAIRRRPHKESISKPLSLEYVADRLDIDHPIFGYCVRSDAGMLQGFISVTTFTNWQRTFRWDSLSAVAMEGEPTRTRWDETGELARSLQATVHKGNIWDEGVVWPRIAEISLLGGLGCGKNLVSIVIEHLERLKATKEANFDFLVLQATENSIPFYESLGFCRVGAVTQVDEPIQNQELRDQEKGLFVSCPLTTHTVKKRGTTTSEIAKKFGVDVWDILFLNKDRYPELLASSRLLAGTELMVPIPDTESPNLTAASDVEYYMAKENDTPRQIASAHSISCQDLVAANVKRLPGLTGSSRLIRGTPVRISHLGEDESIYKPYAHWSFPDDEFEEGEPSYMMAMRLNRVKGQAANRRPVEESLAISITDYEPSQLLLPTPGSPVKRPKDIDESSDQPPAPPKRPPGPFFLYCQEQRLRQKKKFTGMTSVKATKDLSIQWKQLSEKKRTVYFNKHAESKGAYEAAKEAYQRNLKLFQLKHNLQTEATPKKGKPNLFNKVVKLKPHAVTEESDFKYQYWYVLTYIPDLSWCYLAPLEQVGEFGPEKPRAQGRPKYMLVDEKLGREVDISASFCVPIKARSMKRTLDADKEEWDVVDEGDEAEHLFAVYPGERAPVAVRLTSDGVVNRKRGRPLGFSPASPALGLKKKKKKRKLSDFASPTVDQDDEKPIRFERLPAVYPGQSDIVDVHLVCEDVMQQKRGRKITFSPVSTPLSPKARRKSTRSPQTTESVSTMTDRTNFRGTRRSPGLKRRGRPSRSPRVSVVDESELENEESAPLGKRDKYSPSWRVSSRNSSTFSVDTPKRYPRHRTQKRSLATLFDSPRSGTPRAKHRRLTAPPVGDRPRRAAAPSFLGETNPTVYEPRKIPYKPRSSPSRSKKRATPSKVSVLVNSRRSSPRSVKNSTATPKSPIRPRSTRMSPSIAKNTTTARSPVGRRSVRSTASRTKSAATRTPDSSRSIRTPISSRSTARSPWRSPRGHS